MVKIMKGLLVSFSLVCFVGYLVYSGNGVIEINNDKKTDYKFTTVQRTDLIDSVEFKGMMESQRIKDVLSLSAGEVSQIALPANNRVVSGQVVVWLKNEDLKLEYIHLKKLLKLSAFELDMAKKDYEQAKILYKKDGLSKNELDQKYLTYQQRLYNGYEATKKSVQEKRKQVYGLKVVTPINGVIQGVGVKEGEYIHKGRKLFSVVDTSRTVITLKVPQYYLNKIKHRQRVLIRHPALSAKAIVGRVIRIYSESGIKDRGEKGELRVVCKPSKPIRKFFQGLDVDVSFVLGHSSKVCKVPISAVIKGPDSNYYIYHQNMDGIVRKRVEIGLSNSEYVEVKQGVSEGDRVLVNPYVVEG